MSRALEGERLRIVFRAPEYEGMGGIRKLLDIYLHFAAHRATVCEIPPPKYDRNNEEDDTGKVSQPPPLPEYSVTLMVDNVDRADARYLLRETEWPHINERCGIVLSSVTRVPTESEIEDPGTGVRRFFEIIFACLLVCILGLLLVFSRSGIHWL